MKKINLSASAYLCIILLLPFLLTTCKRQNAHLSSKGSRLESGNDEFIVWHLATDSSKVKQQFTKGIKESTDKSSQSAQVCAVIGSVITYGVTRSGSCAGGYSYTLRLDDIYIFSLSPVGLKVYINGIPFTPTSIGSSHYTVSASYSSFGIADANYCGTDSVSIGFGNYCGSISSSETIYLTPSEACGSTNPDATSTAAHYSYPPTTMSAPRSGGADLGLLVNLCNSCTVRYPDFYVFQYRPTGTTTWTTATVPYPQYLFYSVPLSSGTYDLQGYNECAPGSLVPNNGPTVSGSPATFTVL